MFAPNDDQQLLIDSARRFTQKHYADDRLGRLCLSDDGPKTRDRIVAEACARRAVPIVGVLGGGYSSDAMAVARRHVFMVDALQKVAAVSA